MPNFFISFPTKDDNIENFVSNKKDGEAFVREILMTLDRIDCEKDSKIFIDNSNKNDFINDYKALENLLKIRIGSYNLEETLLQYIAQNSIRIIKSNDRIFDYALRVDCFVGVDRICNQKNQGRMLNRNDFRHCENHPNRIHSKSPLIGGIGGFDNAENLLSSAIGDAKAKRKFLINIDRKTQNFIIRFEDENFINQYHAYHIVKLENNRYNEDLEEINLIKNPHKGIPRAYKLIKYREDKII
jgi:hypothetical protein